MPTSNVPSDSKSRQSSGGRSFFGRKIHKERVAESRVFDDGTLFAEASSGTSSAVGSKSSRHSNRHSSASLDMDAGADSRGLSMTAGVISSIPYESLSPTGKTPIPVDYLPRNDQVPVRKEPLPHHLNKGGGDFHQYPTWEPQRPPDAHSSSQPTGPRPPPHFSQSTMTLRDRPQLPGKPYSSHPALHATHGAANSYSTTDSSTNLRNSGDQASIYSTVSSVTRGSSIFSSDNSSRTAIPQHVHDNAGRPSSSHSGSRQSQMGWHPTQSPSFHSASSFTPEGFHYPRPSDDHIVETQFLALMNKRGWQNLPDQARRQMLAYPPAKKWTLLYQDRLTEYQGEQKRRTQARQTLTGFDYGVLGRAEEEGSPEWYVKRVMDDSISPKQLQSLSVSLRTQPIR